MGQYFYIVNLDKKEYLHPHCFGDGLKLMEFGCSSNGTMTALTFLLRKSDDGGGGDFNEFESYPIVGSWAGDRIVIIGDYDSSRLYQEADDTYKNISHDVLVPMLTDFYIKESFKENNFCPHKDV